MAHRRHGAAAGRPVVFELVVADEAQDRADERFPTDHDGGVDAKTRRPHRHTTRAWRLGVPVAVVGLVGVVLLVGGIVDAERSDERFGSARAALEPIAAEPSQVWTADVDSLDGVVERWGALITVEDGVAVARDVDDGTERWRTPVGPGADCGRVERRAPTTPGTGPLVCVTGDAKDRAAVVLDRTGAEVARRDVRGDAVEPGTDGEVVLASRDGARADDGSTLPYGWTSDQQVQVPGGRGVVVRATDARTGDERWEVELPFVRPENIWQCVSFLDDSARVDVDHLELSTGSGLVTVRGCGVYATLSEAGVRLDAQGEADVVVPLDDGTYLRTAAADGPGDRAYGDVADVVVDAQGGEVWRVPGTLLVPESSDGSASRTRVVSTPEALAGYGVDGTERWRSGVTGDRLLVQTQDIGVLVDHGRIVAVDLATGAERWERSAGDGWPVEAAFTDGDRAILWATSRGNLDGERSRVTAYDLEDGDVLWRVASSRISESLVAVDGGLLRVRSDAVARLG